MTLRRDVVGGVIVVVAVVVVIVGVDVVRLHPGAALVTEVTGVVGVQGVVLIVFQVAVGVHVRRVLDQLLRDRQAHVVAVSA